MCWFLLLAGLGLLSAQTERTGVRIVTPSDIPAGSFVTIPAGTAHFIATETETIVQVHGVGLVGMSYANTRRRQQ